MPRIATAVALFAAIVSASVAASQPPTVADVRVDAFRRVNKMREEKGLKPFVWNDDLAKLAQAHADNMARQDKYGDDGQNGHILDGKGPQDRSPGWWEIVHANYEETAPRAAEVAAKGWRESPPHYMAVTNPDLREAGMGAAQSKSGRWYFCQLFGNKN